MAASYAGLQRPWSISSTRSKNRPPAARATRSRRFSPRETLERYSRQNRTVLQKQIMEEGAVSYLDKDSLHILPLSIIPLETRSLRWALLIKNDRLESVVELFKDEQAGSAQLAVEDLAKMFGWPPDTDAADLTVIRELSDLPSYDVYSLRIQLRELGIAINDHADLRLSEGKSEELRSYMTVFTRPLIEQIFADDDSDVRTIDDIFGLFRDPDKKKVLARLDTIARKLGIDIEGVPKFLEDYGDIYLSLSYYRQCLDQVAPQMFEVTDSLAMLRANWQLQQDDRLMQACDFVEGALNELAADVTGRLESFERNSRDIWDNISAERFREVEKFIQSHHVIMGGTLCSLPRCILPTGGRSRSGLSP